MNHYEQFYNIPPTNRALEHKLHTLKAANRALKLFPIGKSVLRRKIWAVGVGNLKNAALYAGAFHGGEWLTALLLVKFLESLQGDTPLLTHAELTRVFEERGLIVVPMVNPDGVEIATQGAETAGFLKGLVQSLIERERAQHGGRVWQANARGVDLNHNFDAGWEALHIMEQEAGITGPAARQYGGGAPFDQPESTAVAKLCRAFHVKKVIAFHSQGEEIYYHYGDNTPKHARMMADALAALCGYTVMQPEGLASHGGFKDWFIQEFGRPGFTIEIGKGVNPLPIEELEPIFARLWEMLLMGILL